MQTTALPQPLIHRLGLLVVAITLVSLTACLLAPRSQAAFPGENGRIAFQSNRDGNWEIYTMRSDGSDEQRLTTNGAYDGQPAISPDGRKIAFVSLRGGSTARSSDGRYPRSHLGDECRRFRAAAAGQREIGAKSSLLTRRREDHLRQRGERRLLPRQPVSTGVRRQDRRKRPADADSRLHRLYAPAFNVLGNGIFFQTSKTEAILQVGCCGSGSNQVSTAWARLHTGNSSRLPSANFRLKGFSLSGDGKHAVYSFSRYSEFRRWTDQRIWTGTSGCKPKCVLDDFPIAFDSEGARGDGPNYTNPSYAPRGTQSSPRRTTTTSSGASSATSP